MKHVSRLVCGMCLAMSGVAYCESGAKTEKEPKCGAKAECAKKGNHSGHGAEGGHHDSLWSALGQIQMTEAQKKAINTIHARYAAKHHDTAKPMGEEELLASHEQMIKEIKAELTESQRATFEKALAKK